MTTKELLWLSNRLPKAAMREVQAEAQEARDYWSGLSIPRKSAIAAQVAAVEIEVIRHGGLRLLNREPA